MYLVHGLLTCHLDHKAWDINTRRFLCAEIQCLNAGKRDIPLAVGFSVLLTTKSIKLDGQNFCIYL